MKKITETQLMKLEARLDRIQNESRKCLGEVRVMLEYSSRKKTKQRVIIGYCEREEWRQHRVDYRNEKPELQYNEFLDTFALKNKTNNMELWANKHIEQEEEWLLNLGAALFNSRVNIQGDVKRQ